MRAGLLSNPEVIDLINQTFVSTHVLFDDLNKRANQGDKLITELLAHWEYPLELIFMTPACKLVTKLNYFQDLPTIHRDVAHPPRSLRTGGTAEWRSNEQIFLAHVAKHFKKE